MDFRLGIKNRRHRRIEHRAVGRTECASAQWPAYGQHERRQASCRLSPGAPATLKPSSHRCRLFPTPKQCVNGPDDSSTGNRRVEDASVVAGATRVSARRIQGDWPGDPPSCASAASMSVAPLWHAQLAEARHVRSSGSRRHAPLTFSGRDCMRRFLRRTELT
jgi:hypothetical protein